MGQSGSEAANKVASLVFLDLETSGLEAARITEITLVAVASKDFLRAAPSTPRVKHKLSLCLNPRKMIDPVASRLSGLDNFLLEHQGPFDHQLFLMMEAFIERLPPPVCLLAHNGLRFDFPVLVQEVSRIGKSFPDGLLCADTLVAFRELLGPNSVKRRLNFPSQDTQFPEPTQTETQIPGTVSVSLPGFGTFESTDWDAEMAEAADLAEEHLEQARSLARVQEMTPKKKGRPPAQSFRLGSLVETLMGPTWSPTGQLHSAEGDVEALMACASAVAPTLLPWLHENAQPFPPPSKSK